MEKGNPRVFAYLRVSSDQQDVESQRLEVERYAQNNGLEVTDWFQLEMSATKNGFKKRRITELLHIIKPGDVLTVPEISRLARSVKEVHEICSELLKKKVQAHFVKQNLQLKADLPSKIIVNAFGLASEIEADLISQRTKAGLAAAKAKGVKLGNPNLKRDNAQWSAEADAFARSVEKVIRGLQAKGLSQRAYAFFVPESTTVAASGP